MAGTIQPRIYNGTRDILPAQMLQRERLLSAMRRSFQLYGFAPVETPAMEYLEILLGKYGDEEQLIYKLDYRNDQPDRRLALRYDLTVPLARLVAMNADLPMPFKRYQFQPVWRADRPQPHQGRFREFMQCDLDTVGSASLMSDAEILAAAAELMKSLQLPGFVIRVNHRRLLSAMVDAAGLPLEQESAVCASIDKLDKVGLEGVAAELEKRGIPGAAKESILELLGREVSLGKLDALRDLAAGSEKAESALRELEELSSLCHGLGVEASHLRLDLYLARGLSYYTGPIFETVLPSLPHMGSLMGGGRYDGLVGMFLGRDLPAVGATMGLDRILAAMEQLKLPTAAATPTRFLITRFFADTEQRSLALAGELRALGIPTEVYHERTKLKKQFAYADRRGIPYVLTLGPDEVKEGLVNVKRMQDGHQEALALDASVLQTMLQNSQ